MQFFILDLLLQVAPVLVFLFGIPVVAKRVFQLYYVVRTAAMIFEEEKRATEKEKREFSNDFKHFS